jgi:Ni,Fe-hydrogenase III large subunit
LSGAGASQTPRSRNWREIIGPAALAKEADVMTIDDKLERLTERVDAIAQSLELLSTMHRDLEKETAARFSETAARFSETLGFINRLAHGAEVHDRRIDNLEHQ